MEKLKVKIKKLVSEASIPAYAKHGDAGMDLKATTYYYSTEMHCHVYGTGIAVEIPEGYVGLIFPRSSNRKTNVYMCNHIGVVDSGYRGEVMLSFKDRDALKEGTIPHMVKPYEIGDRVGQLIIIPYPYVEFEEADELSRSERGVDGHGSTGN